MATRPKTLTAAAVPVAVGSACAARAGHFEPVTALAALAGAFFIQVGTNLTNDYYDFVKGADDADRLGPKRVTQSGLIAPKVVLSAALISFALAAVCGIHLIQVGGWPVLAIGVASVAAGYMYTGGPYPLAYHGLGDPFVFVFFGPVAVVGTYWVQVGRVDLLPVLASVPVGLLGTALLVVNNLRDIPTDTRAGKRTLAVKLGERFTRVQYAALLVISFVWPVLLAVLANSPAALVMWLAVPLALAPWRTVMGEKGAALNGALAQTARLHAVSGALLTVGLWRLG
ncbi:MAG: 1,4-dihydroxy-2-naphthoate polyprenyltransferase [Myxococcaceae bacterium]|nr:1,4-dihydroxy-2-naphthoate polyprenyltransferase [Myxococcaceae bacterium]